MINFIGYNENASTTGLSQDEINNYGYFYKQLKKVKARVITPVFKDFKNGDYKVIMVFAKQSRGAMARYIIDNNIEEPEEIKGFNVGGYQFDANLSTENEWVFTR